MTAAKDMEYKSSCCEVEVFDEFPFREINFVVRETPCIACEILLENPEKLGDFYWGVINWKFCSAWDVRELDIIKLHIVGDFME